MAKAYSATCAKMIYHLQGKLCAKKSSFVAIDTGGIWYKVFVSPRTITALADRAEIALYIETHWRKDNGPELYGFETERELELFQKLVSVSGVGPKSALGILSIASVDQAISAINEGKTDLLTRASGIGKKTAERIVLELKGKLAIVSSPQALNLMESDLELEDTLMSLGYTRAQAKTAIEKIDPKLTSFKDRLKAALKKNN